MLELKGIKKHLGRFTLGPIELSVPSGEYFVLLGPSGAGKTVLLEIMAGLIKPDSGKIFCDGVDVTSAPPEARGFAMVYQDCALFPHMSVAQNISYGLCARRIKGAERADRIRWAAEIVGLESLLDRDPRTLSGGQKQRVALARAIVIKPRLILLDEPLSALDTSVREALRGELKKIHRDSGLTFIHITHDATEAMSLAERVGVIVDGAIEQIATTEQLFRQPTNRRVAQFLAMPNVLVVSRIENNLCHVDGVKIHAAGADESVKFIWIKPEEILLSTHAFDSSARNQFKCRVTGWEHRNCLLAVHVSSDNLNLTAFITHASFKQMSVETGAELYATFKSSAVHCF